MQLDLCSVTQGETRTWSYFSQAFGLMADLDLGRIHLSLNKFLSINYINRDRKSSLDGRCPIRHWVSARP